jgi:hypothetical protein
MADEPNNKMDETLKAYARKRREEAGAPLEIHPATRRLLQGEVARLRGSQAARSAPGGGWIRFLPRLGFALSICIVLAVVVWSLRPPASSYEMTAAGESEQQTAVFYDREMDAPAKPQPAGPDRAALPVEDSVSEQGKREPAPLDLAKNKDTLYREPKDSEVKQLRDARLPAQQPSPAAPPPTSIPELALNRPAPAAATRARDGQALTFSDENGAKKEVNLGAVMLAENERLETSEFSKALNAGRPASNGAATYQSFDNTKPSGPMSVAVATPSLTAAKRPEETPVALKSNPELALFFSTDISEVRAQTASGTAGAVALKRDSYQSTGGSGVLRNFQIQQAGNEVRVVDADGSIYNGVLTAQPDASASVDSVAEQQRRTADTYRGDVRRQGVDNRATLTFKATGTNRTLNQLVVLDGVVAEDGPSADAQPAPSRRSDAASTRSRAFQTNVVAPTKQMLRFRGQVRVGTSNEVTIDALRVTRE